MDDGHIAAGQDMDHIPDAGNMAALSIMRIKLGHQIRHHFVAASKMVHGLWSAIDRLVGINKTIRRGRVTFNPRDKWRSEPGRVLS